MPGGLLGMPNRPPSPRAGLLTPVIWDRIRDDGYRAGVRGANKESGGGGGRSLELPLQGGQTHSRNVRHSGSEPTPKEWLQWSSRSGTVTTPSGVRVEAYPEGGTVNIQFWTAQGGMGSRPSTQRSVSRLEDVFAAVKQYVRAYQPKTIRFTGATPSHDKVYRRVTPMMARELGGRVRTDLMKGDDPVFKIDFD